MGQQGPIRYWKVRGPRPGTAGRADPFTAVNWADLLALGGGGGGGPPPIGLIAALDDRYVNIDGDTMTADTLVLFRDPVDPMDAVTKRYVDAFTVPPATDTILGTITEPAPDGLQYVRYYDGTVWSWAPTTAGVEFGDGLTVDRTLTPPVVNLQPATDFSIGGLKEPPQSAPDQKDYVRRFNPALAEGWEWAETTTADPYHFTTGLSFDDTTREVSLDPAGPTNLGGVTVPPRDATTNALAIDMGNEALGDPATGELRAPPATDLLLGALTEPPPDGIAYVRQFDLTGRYWNWVEAATAGLQINAVIPDEVQFGPGELDVLVHCYGQHFTSTCVLYASDGVNPAAPIPSSAYVNATEMTFEATPSTITAEILYTITVQDPAAVAPDPVLGAGAEPFRYVESLKVAGETLDRLGIVYVPPDQGLQIAPDGALAARLASETNYGVILDAPFGQGTWVRHGEHRWVPAPLPSQMATHAELGTVRVPARNKHNQGLDLDGNGFLYAPPATHEHLGTLLEPPLGNELWGRTHDTDGNPVWEAFDPVEDVPENAVETFGRTARGWVPINAGVGGLALDNLLFVRLDGDQMRGSLMLAHEGALAMEAVTVSQLNRMQLKAGRGLTLEEGVNYDKDTIHLDIATANDLGGVFVPGNQGLELNQVGELQLAQARPDMIGGLKDAPYDDANPTKSYSRRWGEWVPVEPGGMEEPPANPVATWGRSSAGARGWLEVPTFDHLEGFVSKIGDTMRGPLTLDGPPTNPLHAATKDYVDLSEPQEAPHDGKKYARQDGQWVEITDAEGDVIEEPPMSPVGIWGRSSGGARGWIEIPEAVVDSMDEPPMSPVAIWGRSSGGARGWIALDQTGVVVAGDSPDQKGIVYIPDGGGISLYQDGKIELSPATPTQKGAFIDAPWDGKSYARKDAAWVEAVGSEFTTVGRSPTQALEEGFDPVLKMRSLWVPLATDFLAGAIVEPPVDGKQYSRVNDAMAGAPAWVENTAKGVAVGDVPPTGPSPGDLWFESDSGSLFVFYEDDDSAQWVETGSGSETKATIEIGDAPPPNPTIGQFWWNSVTGQTFIWYDDGTSTQWVQIAPGPEGGGGTGGTVDEAPLDGLQYGRQNGLWTEVVTSYTTISDTPPVNPQIADLWFQGTTLDTFIFYDDGSGPIWVQQNTPADFTGYATETWVQTEISNAIIDAQSFTRAAAEAVGHNTDACEKALAAVEKLSGAVTQLQAGHHALKKRIASLEKRLH